MTTQTLFNSSIAHTIGSFDQLDLLVGASPFGIAVLDRDMRLLMANQRWLDYYAIGGDILIGLNYYEIFPDSPQQWKEIHQRALAGETLENEEDQVLRDDGTLRV